MPRLFALESCVTFVVRFGTFFLKNLMVPFFVLMDLGPFAVRIMFEHSAHVPVGRQARPILLVTFIRWVIFFGSLVGESGL